MRPVYRPVADLFLTLLSTSCFLFDTCGNLTVLNALGTLGKSSCSPLPLMPLQMEQRTILRRLQTSNDGQ